MEKVRVRYAPSPTGHLHIGGARTALFNYLFAKHHQGDFIFRLEDTDVERNIDGGEASQLDNLAWLGIVPDESPLNPDPKYAPYRQMERLDIYQKYTQELLDRGLAYKCFCTPEELDEEHERQVNAGVAPMYNRKCRDLTPEEVKEKEAAGITYNYAVVIDDHTMDITHVFRGEEHLSNTPKQMMIYEMLGWIPPTYGHMTLIVNEQRKKLSKRDESIMQFVSQYKDEGYLPDAMFNFMALLGWSPEGEKEIFTKEELIKEFSENRLSKSPSMFDKDKLTWVNNRYIKDRSLENVIDLCKPFLEKAYDLSNRSEEWINMLVATYHDQLSYGKEIVGLVDLFFNDELNLNDEAKEFMQDESIPNTLKVFKNQLANLDEFTKESIQMCIKATQKEAKVRGKMLYMPLRIATTGIMHGPDLASSICLLGKEKVLSRLEQF